MRVRRGKKVKEEVKVATVKNTTGADAYIFFLTGLGVKRGMKQKS